MPLLLPSSSNKTTTAIIITSVFSIAVAVSFTVPSVSHSVVSCFPIVYDTTVFLLKPPYLYLVINCIVVSIFATSKFTYKSSSADDFSEVVTLVPVPSDLHTGFLNEVHDVRDDDAPIDLTMKDVWKFLEFNADDKMTPDDEKKQQTEKQKSRSYSPEPEENPAPKNDSLEISILKHTRKRPRFSQQKTMKASPEGGYKKTVLGVSKPPRRQDTLETTWKKIMEGRSTPLMKHLKKSDTWQERSHVQSTTEKMTKSENLNDIKATMQKTRLKREPSPGQEELNRRVEAFIKKFNEEMKLQRLESLAKYNDMVNGGTCL